MHHSRANPNTNVDHGESEEIIQPLLQHGRPTVSSGSIGSEKSMSEAVLGIGTFGRDISVEELGDAETNSPSDRIKRHTSEREMSFISGSTNGSSLEGSQRRGSINASISNHIMDMALKHDDHGNHSGDGTGDSNHYISKGRMLSGGFVVHPDAHSNETHESHSIVKQAVTKAARRITHVDPLMGTHGGTHSNHSSPFAMKTAPVMRPAGKIDEQMEQWTLRSRLTITPSTMTSPDSAIKHERSSSDPRSQLRRKRSASNLVLNLNERDIMEDLGSYEGKEPKQISLKRSRSTSFYDKKT